MDTYVPQEGDVVWQWSKQLVAKGEAKGKAEGEVKGKAEGEVKGKAEGVLRLLERRGFAVTDVVRERVTSCTDLPTLDRWFDRAIDAATTEEVFQDD